MRSVRVWRPKRLTLEMRQRIEELKRLYAVQHENERRALRDSCRVTAADLSIIITGPRDDEAV